MADIDSSSLQKNGDDWYINHSLISGKFGIFAVVADWCGHCKSLKQEIKKAQSESAFNFMMLDGDKKSNEPIMKRMGVTGFPTVFIYDTTGHLYDFSGRKAKDFISVFKDLRRR